MLPADMCCYTKIMHTISSIRFRNWPMSCIKLHYNSWNSKIFFCMYFIYISLNVCLLHTFTSQGTGGQEEAAGHSGAEAEGEHSPAAQAETAGSYRAISESSPPSISEEKTRSAFCNLHCPLCPQRETNLCLTSYPSQLFNGMDEASAIRVSTVQ